LLRSRSYVNLIVIDKQPQLQWLDWTAAIEHCAQERRHLGVGGHDDGSTDPDIVLACAGDVVTMETVAAAQILRERLPHFRTQGRQRRRPDGLLPRRDHPHGMDETLFKELFTDHVDVVFAFHGYPGAIHQLVHGRPDADRFRVRGSSRREPPPHRSTWSSATGSPATTSSWTRSTTPADPTRRQRPQGMVRGPAERARRLRGRAPARHAAGPRLGPDHLARRQRPRFALTNRMTRAIRPAAPGPPSRTDQPAPSYSAFVRSVFRPDEGGGT
jgi:hypothetical protein